MTNNIHHTAIIDSKAQLGNNITIGAYSIVGPEVQLADGVELNSHVVVGGNTSIGENTRIFPFAAIGLETQDKKYKGEKSRLIIGKNNVIREYVTINPGTEGGGMITSIGDNCLFMVSSHIAHDCVLGNNIIMANNATLAGHITIGDHAILGGLCAVHQYVRIGSYAMIGGMSAVERDVIPYGVAVNERAALAGVNIIGLKRAGYNTEMISEIRQAYEILFDNTNSSTFAERLQTAIAKFAGKKEVMMMLEFLTKDTSRPICKPKGND